MSWFSHELIRTPQKWIDFREPIVRPQQKKSSGSAYETEIYDQCTDR
jgi:hypothetical protein